MGNRKIKTFTVADKSGNRYNMHLVQEYIRTDTLDGPQISEGLQHYVCEGHRASQNADGSFWITGIDLTVWPVESQS